MCFLFCQWLLSLFWRDSWRGMEARFVSWFEGMPHHGEEGMAAGHTEQSGRRGRRKARLPSPFLFSLEPQCCPHSVDLPASVKASWKHPNRHTQRGFHGDSKSHHFDNEDWRLQSQPCQLDLQTHKAIRAFHPLPQSPVFTSSCSIPKSFIAFRSPDTFETREKFLTLRACKIKKNKQRNKSYTSNEKWQSSHFHCKRGEHRHS